MAVLALGISFRRAPIDLLERLAFTDATCSKAYRRARTGRDEGEDGHDRGILPSEGPESPGVERLRVERGVVPEQHGRDQLPVPAPRITPSEPCPAATDRPSASRRRTDAHPGVIGRSPTSPTAPAPRRATAPAGSAPRTIFAGTPGSSASGVSTGCRDEPAIRLSVCRRMQER